MRKIISILFVLPVLASADDKACAVDAYKQYISLKSQMNKTYGEGFSMNYPKEYSVIKETFAYFAIEEDYEIFTVETLYKFRPDLIETSKTVAEIVPDSTVVQTGLANNQEFVSRTKNLWEEKEKSGEVVRADPKQYMNASMMYGLFLKENGASKELENFGNELVKNICTKDTTAQSAH